MVSFSQSEEAFLFRNVRDIINVWSGGAGQARMNIFVNNGQAELQLTYRLGHPDARHLPYHQHYPNYQYQNLPRKQKSERRRTRDNIRAARYQTAQASPTSSSTGRTSSSPSITTAATSSSSVRTTTSSVSPSPVLLTVVTPVSSKNTSQATLSTSTNMCVRRG